MLNGFTNVVITKDLTDDIKKSIEDLAKKQICVGIPDTTQHEDSTLTNAQLLFIHSNGVRDKTMRNEMQHNTDAGKTYTEAHEMYIHEHGSALYNIPPRPVLEPSIDANTEIIAEQMKKAANVALDNGNMDIELEKVGMIGQNVARSWFTNPDNKWPSNSEDTIKRKGSDKPLIDSGELRKAITYVVKDGDN